MRTGFLSEFKRLKSDEEKTCFVQKNFFHGCPFVCNQNEVEYFNFRKKIADHFNVHYAEVHIVGSAKFGFSPYKSTAFSIESDIDVVISNSVLFDHYSRCICKFHYRKVRQKLSFTQEEEKKYRKFCDYLLKGWMRPDLLPKNVRDFAYLRKVWFDFFKSISHNNCSLGNYKVSGGFLKINFMQKHTIQIQ